MSFPQPIPNICQRAELLSEKDLFRPKFGFWARHVANIINRICGPEWIICIHYQPITILSEEYTYEFIILYRKSPNNVKLEVGELYDVMFHNLNLTNNSQLNTQKIDDTIEKIDEYFNSLGVDSRMFTNLIISEIINKLHNFRQMNSNGVICMDFTQTLFREKMHKWICENDSFFKPLMLGISDSPDADARYYALGVTFNTFDEN